MWLSLLAVVAAVAPKVAPLQIVKLLEWDNRNKLGQYRWFDDRLFELDHTVTPPPSRDQISPAYTTVVVDRETKEQRSIVFPVATWAAEHTELLYDKKLAVVGPGGHPMAAVTFTSLVHVDRGSGVSYYDVTNWNGFLDERGRNRRYLVRWPGGDAVRIGESSDDVSIKSVAVVDGRWYFAEQHRDPDKRGTLTLTSIDLTTNERKDIWKQEHARGGMWSVAKDASRLVYVEYSERSQGVLDPPAHLYVIETATGAAFSVDAPITAYGIAFVPSGNALLVGSNELGTIQRLDLEKHTWTPLAKGLPGLQHIQVAPSGKTVFVMQRGAVLTRFQIEPWAPLPSLAIDSFMPGRKRYSWDWSRFSPSGKYLLASRNKLSGTVDFLEMEKPGVSLFEVRD